MYQTRDVFFVLGYLKKDLFNDLLTSDAKTSSTFATLSFSKIQIRKSRICQSIRGQAAIFVYDIAIKHKLAT